MYDLAFRYIELEKLAEKLQKDVERLTKELKVGKDLCYNLQPLPSPPTSHNGFYQGSGPGSVTF
jgi:hypothetical protein